MNALSSIQNISHIDENTFFLLAGPCVVENESIVFQIAEKIKSISDKHRIPFVFKASYRKANRTSLNSFSGIGDQEALRILQKVKENFELPLVTDIHTSEEAAMAAEVVDILQIPAFLCRQTDLLIAAGNTGKFVNIKKGQFLAPNAMKHAAQKVLDTGNNKIMLTERGTSFGYSDLIVDFRGIPEMKETGYPVIMDITHSLQQPNQSSGITGGRPDMIETIAKAAISTGADGLFIETHPNPAIALSDGANMLQIDLLEDLLIKMKKLYFTVNNW